MAKAHRSTPLVILVCALAVCDGVWADKVIGPLAAETPVRAWGGIALLSIHEASGYRLATQQGTEAPRAMPGIAPAAHPFDANIGPGPNGSPLIVFVRCASAHRCGLMRTTVVGNAETPIGAAGVGGNEHAPAVWRDRLAFAQPSRSGSDWVYIVPLEAGRRARPVRLRSAPRPQCVGGCRAPHPTVIELSLRGSTLAENVNLGLVEANAPCERTEVRVVDLAHRRSRRVEQTDCGPLSPLLGASLTSTHLIYAAQCSADPEGCPHNHTYVYRYGLRNDRLEVAPEPDFVTGIAAEDDSHVVEVRAPDTGGGYGSCRPVTQPPCQLVRVGPIKFKPLH